MRRLSATLAARWGARPGETIALLAPNSAAFVIACFAIVRLGAIEPGSTLRRSCRLSSPRTWPNSYTPPGRPTRRERPRAASCGRLPRSGRASDLRRRLSDIFQVGLEPDLEDISADEIATWDSINKLRLILELEEAFDVNLSDEEVVDLASFRQTEDLLRTRGVTP